MTDTYAVNGLGMLHEDLIAAYKVLKEARSKLGEARAAETAAVNRVNTIQKALDAALKTIHDDSPTGVEWSDPARKETPERPHTRSA